MRNSTRRFTLFVLPVLAGVLLLPPMGPRRPPTNCISSGTSSSKGEVFLSTQWALLRGLEDPSRGS